MGIMAEGPCPKCGKHDFWWGKDKDAAMDMREIGCWRCRMTDTIVISIIMGIVVSVFINWWSRH